MKAGVLERVREYREEMPVELRYEEGRWTVVAINEGGYNSTAVDLMDLVRALGLRHPCGAFVSDDETGIHPQGCTCTRDE